MEKFPLEAMAREHLERAQSTSGGRSAETVYGGHERALRQTLLALVAGARLAEHESPGEATLTVLIGRVRLWSHGSAQEAGAGELLVVPEERHGLLALADSAVLLTVAKRG